MPEYSDQLEVAEGEGSVEASEIQDLINDNEEKMMRATMEAMESGSLTPLVKEELRCAIQSRRLAAGKGELRLEEFKKPSKKKTMTDEERKRAQVRRVQNREAAQRFRQRQKDLASHLTDKIKRLEKASVNLQTETARLKNERDELRKMLADHLSNCTNQVPVTEDICPDLQQFLQRLINPSVTCDDFSVVTPHCPNTSDSSSSVFFPDDACFNQNNSVTYENLFQHIELRTMEISQDNGGFVLDLMQDPEIYQEMVIGDTDVLDSMSEYSDDQRLDSCSSTETVSTYGSVSSETYTLTEMNSNFQDAMTATMVHMTSFDSEPFETTYVTDDMLFLHDPS